MNRLSGAVSERGAPRSLAATSANLSPWGFRCATRSSIRCHVFYCLACRGSVGLVVGTPRIIEPHCSPYATLSGRCYQRRREPVARARMARWHQFQLRGCSGYPGAELYPKLVQVLSVRNARASADQVRVSMSSRCREQAPLPGRSGVVRDAESHLRGTRLPRTWVGRARSRSKAEDVGHPGSACELVGDLGYVPAPVGSLALGRRPGDLAV